MKVESCCPLSWVEKPNTCSHEPKIDGFFGERLIYNLIYPSGHNDFIWFQVIFFNIVESLTFFNVVLNGLKQDTFNGYRACDE
jgi:hypothetical protein